MTGPDRHAATGGEPRSRWLCRDQRKLHLLEWGAGQEAAATILCLHGGCANAHWWDASARLISDNYRILALDFCGHGDSDHLESGDYSVEGHRDDVAHVVEALDLRDFVLAGHSFGGFIAVAALPLLRERLSGLVLVDSRGHIREQAARYLNALRKFPNPIYATREDAIRGFQLLPRDSTAPAEVLARVAQHSIRRSHDGTWTLAFDRRALRAAEARRFDNEMEQWHGPTLLVRGAASGALSASALAEMQRELPQAEVVEIAEAHHHVMLDRPAALAKELERFIGNVSRAPRSATPI